MKKMCKNCRGSGRILGGGFMELRCAECNGSGKVEVRNAEDASTDNDIAHKDSDVSRAVKIDKRSKAYKDAITQIMEKSGLSDTDAKAIFDQEMEKD